MSPPETKPTHTLFASVSITGPFADGQNPGWNEPDSESQ